MAKRDVVWGFLMGKHRSAARNVSGAQWRRVNRRALRLAAFSLLLPVPVALAAPNASLSSQQLAAMSSVPVSGVGDTMLPQVLPLADLERVASKVRGGPTASMTKVARHKRAASASAVAANGIPRAAYRAYRTAEATMNVADPSCQLSWGLLAGIGRVESDHGRYGDAVVGRDGQSTPQIIGVPLNGAGSVAAIPDTDGGRLDGDRRWDRAVGPMQFIPSTWAMVGVDGDGDGKRNPHDLGDAALAAAAYLCVGDRDLSTSSGVRDAVFSYNHSKDYVALVLSLANAYQNGVADLPVLSATGVTPTGPGVAVGLGQPGRIGMLGGGGDDDARGRDNGSAGDDSRRGDNGSVSDDSRRGDNGSADDDSRRGDKRADDRRSDDGGGVRDDEADSRDSDDRDDSSGPGSRKEPDDSGSRNRGGSDDDSDSDSGDSDNSGPKSRGEDESPNSGSGGDQPDEDEVADDGEEPTDGAGGTEGDNSGSGGTDEDEDEEPKPTTEPTEPDDTQETQEEDEAKPEPFSDTGVIVEEGGNLFLNDRLLQPLPGVEIIAGTETVTVVGVLLDEDTIEVHDVE